MPASPSKTSWRSALRFSLVLLALLLPSTSAYWTPPATGRATLTHYDLPSHYIASCGCVGQSTDYPTAAVNSLTYGGTLSFGPACGLCAKLTLSSTVFSPPPPDGNGIVYADGDSKAPSVVVKITDLCPVGGEWCNATETQGNKMGSQVHFDLAWPAKGIPQDFFPGDHDYGGWYVNYAFVPCSQWAGWKVDGAQGSDFDQETSACCPSNPLLSSVVGAGSGQGNGSTPPPSPPPTTTADANATQTSTSASLSASSNATATGLTATASATSSSTSFNITVTANGSLVISASSSRATTRLSLSSTSTAPITRRAVEHDPSSFTLARRSSLTSLFSEQTVRCPSYSELAAEGLTSVSMAPMVPNTSNPLTKGRSGVAVSSAAVGGALQKGASAAVVALLGTTALGLALVL